MSRLDSRIRMVTLAAMRDARALAETGGITVLALALVVAAREGPWHDLAWWLVPFVWVAAASLPALWDSEYRLGAAELVGQPLSGLTWVLRVSLIVFPPFTAAYLIVIGSGLPTRLPDLPPQFWSTLFYQLVYIGFAEELFFRGYLQIRLDRVLGRSWRVFGTAVGPGLLIANLLFAVGHVLVTQNPLQADVFFPGLLFGWLRARTGAILAPAAFHGLCNVLLITLQTWSSS